MILAELVKDFWHDYVPKQESFKSEKYLGFVLANAWRNPLVASTSCSNLWKDI